MIPQKEQAWKAHLPARSALAAWVASIVPANTWIVLLEPAGTRDVTQLIWVESFFKFIHTVWLDKQAKIYKITFYLYLKVKYHFNILFQKLKILQAGLLKHYFLILMTTNFQILLSQTFLFTLLRIEFSKSLSARCCFLQKVKRANEPPNGKPLS